jgi:aminoglycoside phosphotransferase (APT) family kinase protein
MTEQLDLEAVEHFLRGQGVEIRGELRADLIAGGKSNLTYKVSDAERSWVLRRPPTAGRTPSAHDVAREYRVMQALQGSAVPVPQTVALCTSKAVIGADFSVVGHVPGRALRVQSDLLPLDDSELARCNDGLVHALAELHHIDHPSATSRSCTVTSGWTTR